MVATRRGAQVSSPAKTAPEQSSDVLATPSTGRRTRTAVKQVECPTRHVVVETSSQLEKVETELPASPPTSPLKRCTRASRLHSPELPCTPVGSIHEADMSDLESCCSVLSDIDPPTTRTRGRRRPPCAVIPKDEDISEVESCSSAVSASKAALVSRRSTRRSTAPKCYDPAGVGVEEVTDDHALESESCTSVVSESKRVTRSQRKTARTRSSAKQQIEDSEVSDADSYISGGSRAKVSHRATKSRRPTRSIPLHLDEATESSHSPAPRSRPTRAVRGKASAIIDVSDPQSPDSDGLESGPTYSMTTRQRGKTKTTISIAMDSDPELTDRETPCSSRAGSGNSRVSTHSVKDVSIVVERTRVSGEEESLVDDSRLESTLTTDDVDCTLLEEHESQTLEEKEVGNRGNLTSSEADTKKVERGEKEVVTEPVVMVTDQQEELSTENIDEDTSEVEMMQETIRPSMLLKPCRSVSVTCEKASESNKEKGQTVEVADAHIQSSQGDKAVDEDAVVETRPNVEENMEVSTLSTDAQQVVESGEARVSSIQITMSQHKKITVDSSSLEQPQDAVVQNTKIISLLDSSDDEDDVSVVEEEEEEEDLEYRTAGPSKASETAASSVEGLFMIDTRPGQDADELYYKERPTEEQEDTTKRGAEEEEQDEEFVDEEDDDDDDDNLLFSSRSLQLNNMSTRIDPGIRVKELGGLYINFGGKKSKPVSSSLQKLKETKIQDEVMKKSVIGPDFEKKDAVPPYSESKHALKLKRKAERGMTTGDGWFNMKAPEITQELKTDLNVLKMRGSLDPKRFYKKNDRDGFSKYFQVGTVVDSAVDFYHSRIPKKERKRTMVEELLADAEFRHKNKKKYQQIVLDKAAQGAGRKNKKKNKFHKK